MTKLFIEFFLTICLVNFAVCDSENVEEALNSNEIVQDVIDVAPKGLLKVNLKEIYLLFLLCQLMTTNFRSVFHPEQSLTWEMS